MVCFIIGLAVLPQAPQNCDPAVRQTTKGMALGFAMRTNAGVIGICPNGSPQRGLGPLLSNVSKLMVARVAELNASSFSAADCDRTGACQCLNTVCCRKPSSIITELGKQCWLEESTCSRQRGIDFVVRVLGEKLSQLFQHFLLGRNHFQQHPGQGLCFWVTGFDHVCSCFGIRLLQLSQDLGR